MLNVRSTLLFLLLIVSVQCIKAQNGFDTEWAHGTNAFKAGSSSLKSPFICAGNDGRIILAERFNTRFQFQGLELFPSFPESTYECVIISLDSNGNILWNKTLNTPVIYNNIVLSSVACDSENNIYVAGFSESNIVIDNNYYGDNIESSFILKLNEDGNIIWFKQIFENGNIQQMETDSEDNVLLLVANYDDEDIILLNGDTIFGDMSIMKMDGDGSFYWNRSAKMNMDINWVNGFLNKMILDENNAITVSSNGKGFCRVDTINFETDGYWTSDTFYWEPDTFINTYYTFTIDIFFFKYDTQGELEFTKRIHGIGDQESFGVAKYSKGYAIVIAHNDVFGTNPAYIDSTIITTPVSYDSEYARILFLDEEDSIYEIRSINPDFYLQQLICMNDTCYTANTRMNYTNMASINSFSPDDLDLGYAYTSCASRSNPINKIIFSSDGHLIIGGYYYDCIDMNDTVLTLTESETDYGIFVAKLDRNYFKPFIIRPPVYETNTFETFIINPNPSSDFIQLTTPYFKDYSLQIYTITGQQISLPVYQISSTTFQFDIRSLPEAMYIISIQNSELQEVMKFIKE